MAHLYYPFSRSQNTKSIRYTHHMNRYKHTSSLKDIKTTSIRITTHNSFKKRKRKTHGEKDSSANTELNNTFSKIPDPNTIEKQKLIVKRKQKRCQWIAWSFTPRHPSCHSGTSFGIARAAFRAPLLRPGLWCTVVPRWQCTLELDDSCSPCAGEVSSWDCTPPE